MNCLSSDTRVFSFYNVWMVAECLWLPSLLWFHCCWLSLAPVVSLLNIPKPVSQPPGRPIWRPSNPSSNPSPIWPYSFIFHKHSLDHLSINLGVEFLGPMVILCLVF